MSLCSVFSSPNQATSVICIYKRVVQRASKEGKKEAKQGKFQTNVHRDKPIRDARGQVSFVTTTTKQQLAADKLVEEETRHC